MATTYYQPGVYIQEIDTPQVQIQSAPTAIPAFVGFTQTAQANKPNDLLYVPTLITSLLDYVNFFGMGPGPSVSQINLDANNNFIDADVTIHYKMYDVINLFYQNGGGNAYIVSVGTFPAATTPTSALYTGNGTTINPGCFAPLAKLQDPTLLVFPDVMLCADWYSVYTAALLQCSTLQSTFTILDFYYNPKEQNLTYQNPPGTYNYSNEVAAFRSAIGMDNLNYGAAYGPWTGVLPTQSIAFSQVQNIYADGVPATLYSLTTDTTIRALITSLQKLVADTTTINNVTGGVISGLFAHTSPALTNHGINTLTGLYTFLQTLVLQSTTATEVNAAIEYIFYSLYSLGSTLQNYATGSSGQVLTNPQMIAYVDSGSTGSYSGIISSQFAPLYNQLRGYEETLTALGSPFGGTGYTSQVSAFTATPDNAWEVSSINVISGTVAALTIPNLITTPATLGDDLANAQNVLLTINSVVNQIIAQYSNILAQAQAMQVTQQTQLTNIYPVYSSIVKGINNTPIALPPSGAMAGLYAYVDNTFGVWKSPANISINGIVGPDWAFASSEYDNLNVDINAGKSINAIRTFTGKGTLVWGARTLAGNDTHWRYVSVRRFFIMVEQAVKAALGAYVFEPNDANTWTTVIAEVNSYLFGLWRAGALMGNKPEQAYSVQCGLGATMTQDDILNGRMIVTIGMAVVRPAEFIILQFTQNVQAQGN